MSDTTHHQEQAAIEPHGPIDIQMHVPPAVYEEAYTGYMNAVDEGFPGTFARYLVEHATVRNEIVRVDGVAPELEARDE